jgi:hypothetical protein
MFTQFYNQSIRRMVVAFGGIFNQIKISRTESSGTKYIEVPLAYAAKEKYKVRLAGDPYLQNPMQITLPRMAFEITGFAYDPSRKRNSSQRNIVRDSTSSGVKYTFSEVPYNIDFGLYVYTRNMDDGLQIIEQILPYFAPEFVATINFDAVNTKVDVPIYLNSVSSEEDYEGDFQNRRSIIFTLNFTMKSYIFGNVRSYNEIRKVDAKIYDFNYFPSFTAGNTLGGVTGTDSKVFVGITGPSGASSAKYNYTPYAKIYEYQTGYTLAAGVTVDWLGTTGLTGTTG